MSERYYRYLASREWALKREAVRERSGDICERCRVAPQQAVHHLTYARLYHEPLEDLQAICDPCHAFESGKSTFDPRTVIAVAEETAAVAWAGYEYDCVGCGDPISMSLECPCKYCADVYCYCCLYVHHEDGGACGMARRDEGAGSPATSVGVGL